MALIPIAGTSPIIDADYRYKMPRLLAKVEGRGNGVKTVVVNMKEVADALHRSAGEITKFFGCELGAQTSWKDETEKSIVNGNHTAQALQQHLSRYIQNFVLCERCQLPETMYRIKNGAIFQKCDACGSKEMVDMSHKLTTFILNTHKKAAEDSKEKKKKDRKKDKDKDKEKGEEGTEDKKEKKEKKKDKDKKEKKKDKKKSKDGSKDGSEGENGHAEEGSLKVSSGGSEGSMDEDDDDVPTDENVAVEDAAAFESCVERIKLFLSEHPTASAQEVLDELRQVSTFSALPTEERMFLFVDAAFGPAFPKDNAVGTHKVVLRGLILSVDAAAYQRRLIGAMEYMCAAKHPELLKWFPLVLKQLYDEDLVEEEVFLEWAEDDTINEFTRRDVTEDMVHALHSQAAKFITWLKEAETDDEEDDDDEEEDDDDDDA